MGLRLESLEVVLAALLEKVSSQEGGEGGEEVQD